ncbi:MAG: indolepyruvate ferredoxin oxidoreductase subunit alpha [Actinobacteria bacterium HGW-Actinobacteria-10]|nr:MAG: indolepyruvate ferredoxin oxidoreductase subunit alpha [Actinobacteria bacterium HGW-Actinobacteria-10]
MTQALLSGNEAIARGAWEAGAALGIGYPGTPSTETLENLARMTDVHCEWAPNEKVALEVAIGASMGGARVLVTMKHVGVNVAADPLLTLVYTGVGAGLVILAADDPGMHSSQNEQDTRNWGPFAHVPILEPSDSAEALAMVKTAFEISERFDVPVVIRSTTRLSHSKGLVETGKRHELTAPAPFESDTAKWVMLPGNARGRRIDLASRIAALTKWNENEGPDTVELRGTEIGIVASGVPYQYVREAMPEASTYKVAMSYPLNARGLREFAGSVDRVYVVEEADPYLNRSLRAMGLDVADLPLPPHGELSPAKIARAFGSETAEVRDAIEGLPARPPLMCPGCPHRPVFHALNKARAIVMGDIGCYTLGALPPLSAMDSCVCMGAGIGMSHGMALAGQGTDKRPIVSVIGDSTFAHSGITGLVHLAYNQGSGTVIILDNRITAMTGHQGNPMMGRTLMGETVREVDLEALCAAFGIGTVRVVDPHDLPATQAVIREEVSRPELSVIVFRSPCALLIKEKEQPYAVDSEACTACGACIKLGCPAISTGDDGRAQIDITVCVGCADCVQVCRFDAIVPTGSACEIGGV